MNIVVLVKAVPIIDEEVELNEKETDIRKEYLKHELNEWDNYALENALQLTEKHGGEVTAITISSESGKKHAQQVLCECYAKGVNHAIHVVDEAVEEFDAYTLVKILHTVIKDINFDLILIGIQTSDDNNTQTGPMLAELLGLPYSSIITNLEIKEAGVATVYQELEEGVQRVIEIKIPALFTIQTNPENLPRYASFSKIRRAMRREIKTLSLSDLNLDRNQVLSLRRTLVSKMNIPVAAKTVKLIEGSPEESAAELARILREVLA